MPEETQKPICRYCSTPLVNRYKNTRFCNASCRCHQWRLDQSRPVSLKIQFPKATYVAAVAAADDAGMLMNLWALNACVQQLGEAVQCQHT